MPSFEPPSMDSDCRRSPSILFIISFRLIHSTEMSHPSSPLLFPDPFFQTNISVPLPVRALAKIPNSHIAAFSFDNRSECRPCCFSGSSRNQVRRYLVRKVQ
jgi:hypothetical protein